MVTYTLTNPINVGSMSSPVTISSLQVTGVNYSSTPSLAPIGAGQLAITLLDPVSRWLETIAYKDASALSFWQTASSLASGSTLDDIVSFAAFTKLMTDGKLPPGTIVQS